MSTGPRPDRFLVGLAVRSQLADAAAEQSLVCMLEGLPELVIGL